jgi:hypothetical protein
MKVDDLIKRLMPLDINEEVIAVIMTRDEVEELVRQRMNHKDIPSGNKEWEGLIDRIMEKTEKSLNSNWLTEGFQHFMDQELLPDPYSI